MKKTFPLQSPGKDDARTRDKIRHELNKYFRRERQKKPPEGYDYWDFDCRVGNSAANAEAKSVKEVGSAIDAVAAHGATEVYVEILAKPQRRTRPTP